jgi:hypothetical protein
MGVQVGECKIRYKHFLAERINVRGYLQDYNIKTIRGCVKRERLAKGTVCMYRLWL